MSARVNSALRNAPATKPICTDMVNQAASAALRFHSMVNTGATAEAENHSPSTSNSATAIDSTVHHLLLTSPSLPKGVGRL